MDLTVSSPIPQLHHTTGGALIAIAVASDKDNVLRRKNLYTAGALAAVALLIYLGYMGAHFLGI